LATALAVMLKRLLLVNATTLQDIPYIAMDHFVRVAEFFNIPPIGAPLILIHSAAQDFCYLDWNDQQAQFASRVRPTFALENYCFEGLFSFYMLTRGYVVVVVVVVVVLPVWY
jgi:hypothetical protein